MAERFTLNTLLHDRENAVTLQPQPAEAVSPTRFLLPYLPPYDWSAQLHFLQHRAVAGVEETADGGYQRTVTLKLNNDVQSVQNVQGWISLRPAAQTNALILDISPSLVGVADMAIARARRLFDLDANPGLISTSLGALAQDRPGLRLPGCVDCFEQTVRAILGQLVSVKMAATLTQRLTHRWGETLAQPHGGLSRLFPTPQQIALLTVDDLRSIGVQAKRSASLIALAQAVAEGRLSLEPAEDTEAGMKTLRALPGIGAWTASYIAMRAWSAPDVFLTGDYLIKQRFPAMTPGQIVRYAQRWQPFRSYATLHLWHNAQWLP